MIPSFAGEDTMRFRMLKILRPMILRFIIRSLQINFLKKNDEVDVRGEKFVISESVFNPKLFYSSELMIDALDHVGISPDELVLDMGTGSGILAIMSAKKGARVVAIDINGEATKCAKMNAKNHGVDIEVICSDLFSCFKEQRIFDLIIFNIPYLNIKPRDTFDLSICDYRKEMLRRFLDESHKYLKDGGKILMTYSSVSDINETERIFGEMGWHFEKILERDISEFESIVVYKLKKAKV